MGIHKWGLPFIGWGKDLSRVWKGCGYLAGMGQEDQNRKDANRAGKLGESSSLSCEIWETVGMVRG